MAASCPVEHTAPTRPRVNSWTPRAYITVRDKWQRTRENVQFGGSRVRGSESLMDPLESPATASPRWVVGLCVPSPPLAHHRGGTRQGPGRAPPFTYAVATVQGITTHIPC